MTGPTNTALPTDGVASVAAVTSDYLPTILEFAGIEYPDDRPLDGISLVGIIRGTSSTRNAPIGFQSKKQIAWHSGNEKIYSDDEGQTWQMFDLGTDPGETSNIAKQQTPRVLELVREVREWQISCRASDKGRDY